MMPDNGGDMVLLMNFIRENVISSLQEGILRSFRVYVVNRACPGRMVM